MLQAFPRSRIWLLALLIAMLLLLSPAAKFTAQAAVNDTPTPFVTDDDVLEWTVGSGLAYWGHGCGPIIFASPAADTDQATISRIPAVGGQIRRLDSPSADDTTYCDTYHKLLSSSNGLYYFETVTPPPPALPIHHIMRMQTNAPYTPHEVKVLDSSQMPDISISNKAFVEDNGFLYWSTASQTIVRMRKDGSGNIQTVATTDVSPDDILIVGTTIFWTDLAGVHAKSISCATLPCTGGTTYQSYSVGSFKTAHGLMYERIASTGPIIVSQYRLYWVESSPSGANDTSYSIMYLTCMDNRPCGDAVGNPGTQAQSANTPDAVNAEPQTLYTSALSYFIGNPVLVNGNVYWTEFNNAANDGSVKRKPDGKTAADPQDDIATSLTNLDSRLFVFNGNLYFARTNTGLGIYTLSLNATPILRDLAITGMEVTQAIQNLNNDVPLIATKPTYVRVYGFELSGPNTPDAELILNGTRDGIPLPGSPLKPVNGILSINTLIAANRINLNDGWYFKLPDSWITAGAIQLQAIIDPRHLHNDSNLSDNVFPTAGALQVTFQTQPPVCVDAVPVRTHDPLPSVYDLNFSNMVDQFNRRWPIPSTWVYYDSDPVEELEVCTWHYIPYPCFGPYELSDGWGITNGPPDRDKVIASLWTRQLLSFNPDACDNIGAPVQAMGMVNPNADNGGASGYASLVSTQSWVQLPEHDTPLGPDWDSDRPGWVMAQDLAHNHGRKHVDCGGPSNIDTNYPYPPCQLGPNDANAFFGFDSVSRRPIGPTRAGDFMSYRDPAWVSDYTYSALFNDFVSASAAAATPDNADASDQVFVTGMVDGENPRGEITQLLILPGNTLPTSTRQAQTVSAASVDHEEEPPTITYTLRFLDATNKPIDINGNLPGADRKLVLEPLDDHTNESLAQVFKDIFPEPAQQPVAIVLLANGQEIDRITAGTHVPTVSVQKPVAGTVVDNQMTIQWTANDADPNDRLKFTVQYSHDNGASWQVVGMDIPSTPTATTTLVITDLGSLQGSAPNAAKIRVLASDGYNTGIATSANFTVNNRPPLVGIVAPSKNQTVPGGEAVLLQGMATDPEDGGLSGNSLKWHVDGIDYGTGDSVNAAGLGSFAHTAAFAATDSNSQTVTATVNFNVAPVSIPLGAEPTFDGECSDSSYTSAINLPLSPYGNATQANVRIMRSDNYMWLCFTDLISNSVDSGDYVGVRVDVDNSRDPLAKATDLGFFVAKDGSVISRQGDGNGNFVDTDSSDMAGQILLGSSTWSAELRIDKAAFNGWGHLISMAVGHHSVSGPGDDYVWPFQAQLAKPNTWSQAALGIEPVIDDLTPNAAPVNSSAVSAAAVNAASPFTVTVTGSNFVSGTQVLWNGQVLPTTLITDGVLIAQVSHDKLDKAGVVIVTTRSPAPDGFISIGLPFIVEGAKPVITSLSPGSKLADSKGFVLTIQGSNFVTDSKVLWNDTELTPQSVNAHQITVQIDSSLLINGRIVGVAVANPTPNAQISSIAPFDIEARNAIFVPGLFNQK